MTEQQQISIPMELPALPAKHVEWIAHVASHPDEPLSKLMAPYKEYDATLRQIFAQQPNHPAINIPNVVPVYGGCEQALTIRARNPANEPEDERQHYIMPLSKADRKPSGSPAVVSSLNEFERNFQLFSESSLVDLDWSNVVAAGSAVVTSLLPVPEEHKASKRALREHYHQYLAPASDVDLFLYGLTEEEAVEKIKQIEQRIKDSILTETTTIRTKNAITIASQYPTRHVQIVLRIYRSISEILTGFDVDCSCVAYDGKQVYASPRALAAFMTQINTIDLTRRSPSYENRLSKYARRGFEVYWPLLDRSRIDPTLFERSFGKTLGLARLLMLERLPENHEREAYIDERRAERGRPKVNRRFAQKQWGNIKDAHEEDVAEWVETNEVSDYHTFTIPYGPKYHARKIEKLLYAKDLLLNAEWNRPKDRETALHRHPAFFGNATDIIEDCCGYCPKPITPEEEEIAAEESKIYVSGPLSFIKDDPGRQAIGSFHPLTDDDWTEMAYVGNTARLCRAIVDRDLEHVQDWLSQEGADPNRRDYTGRTPLHLAVTTSTPEIVQALIDAGARLISRLFDGKTALHLAAMRGETEMARALLIKSEANEEKEAEKETLKQRQPKNLNNSGDPDSATSKEDSEDDDMDCSDYESENEDVTTEGSFIKITPREPQSHEALPEDSDDEPDIYDINVLAWDTPVTALHLAIANGHVPMVKLLVQDFGADVLLPIKLVNVHSGSPRASILPLVLVLHLPPEKAKEMTRVLISSGASPAQGDVNSETALSYFAAHGEDLLRTMISSNQSGAERAANHISMPPNSYSGDGKSALHMAIQNRDLGAVDALLELGVKPEIDFDTYIASAKHHKTIRGDTEYNQWLFKSNFKQPVFYGVSFDMPSAVRRLVDAGADVNVLSPDTWEVIRHPGCWKKNIGTLLDVVRKKMQALQTFTTIGKVDGVHGYVGSTGWIDTGYTYKCFSPIPLQNDDYYLRDLKPGTYAHFMVSNQIRKAKVTYQSDLENYQQWSESQKEPKGTAEKKSAAESMLKEFEALECYLLECGAKTLKELRPEVNTERTQDPYYYKVKQEPPKPWEPNLTFALPDLTNERKEAYIKLFEACWDGNLSTIKDLTLGIWGNNQTPLKIAVLNSDGLSPLAVAVLRKHYGIARAILEIAHAQHAPEQTPMVRHTIQSVEKDESSTCDDQDDIQIYREIVDERFTIENIGEVQAQVQSTTTPLEMIQSDCPALEFMPDYGILELSTGIQSQQKRENEVLRPQNLVQFAIYSNDSNLLEFLIENCEEYAQPTPWASDETSPKFFNFPEADLRYALRLGRVQLLEMIIQRTGAGFPLDDLIEQNGIEISIEPKCYQGLSVHGKKRTDWANAARGAEHKVPDVQHPPLLWAARFGNLQSVEWFLGNAPLRCYLQFADNHREDIRIQNLATAKGGIETSITKWLDLRSHLLLHCVVMGPKSEDTLLMLRHLCRTYPEALEKRSKSGMTPLNLAFALHRVEMVKVLLEAGADQTTRGNNGNNIIHSMLEGYDVAENTPVILRELLGLIDARLLPSLFLERTQDAPGAATPLARWIHVYATNWERRSDQKHIETVIQLLLEFSKGEDLGIINGDGDTSIHAAVRYGADTLLRIMLDSRPEILFYENASGRTPFEIAEDSYLSREIFNDPPSLSPVRRYGGRMRPGGPVYAHHNVKGILGWDPSSFVQENRDDSSNIAKVLQVCKDFAGNQSEGHKRRLVSLVEANEVAKRLAVRNTGIDPDEEEDEEFEEQEDEENDWRDDEVKVWFDWGLR